MLYPDETGGDQKLPWPNEDGQAFWKNRYLLHTMKMIIMLYWMSHCPAASFVLLYISNRYIPNAKSWVGRSTISQWWWFWWKWRSPSRFFQPAKPSLPKVLVISANQNQTKSNQIESSEVYRRSLRRGFEFTLMVVGE